MVFNIVIYIKNWSLKASKTDVSKLYIKKQKSKMIYFDIIFFFWFSLNINIYVKINN